MFIDFSQHSETTVNFAHVFQPGEIDLNDESARVSSELEIAGTAHQNGETAEVKGRLLGKVEIACHRCLQPLEVALDLNFEENFVTLESYEKSSAEHAISSADLDVSVYNGERIDITDMAREQVLLNLPTRQLCTENCAGLCQKCGVNKNSGHCSCENEEHDPRWDALKNLTIKN